MLNLEALFSQDNIPYTRQEYSIYLLVKINPEGGFSAVSRLPMNLALLIDNSGSMYGNDKRIHLAIEAANHAIGLLSQEDVVSVIAFSDQAQVVQNATRATNPNQISQAIKGILSLHSGGTYLATGMQTGCNELRRNLSRERSNRMLILTDGNTENEEQCQETAVLETKNGISFSTFGVGEDWNEKLIRNIADRSGGRWHYIENSGRIAQHFQDELGVLLTTAYSNVRLNLKFFQNDILREVKIVSPEIKDVVVNGGNGAKQQEIIIGSMQKEVPTYLLLTMTILSREPGQYNLANISLTYDMPGQPNQSTRPQNLRIACVTDSGMIYNNGEVLRWVDDAQLDKMVRRATDLAASGDTKRATQLFENAQALSGKRGDKRKTQLITEALNELDSGGSISRKTQLQALNQSRKTQLMPSDED